MWLIDSIAAGVPGSPDLELAALLDRVRRCLVYAHDLALRLLKTLLHLCADSDRAAVLPALVRLAAPALFVHLLAWLFRNAPPAAAGGAEPCSHRAVAAVLRDVLLAMLVDEPAAAAAIVADAAAPRALLAATAGGWHALAAPALAAVLHAPLRKETLAAVSARYLDILRESLDGGSGMPLTMALLQGLQVRSHPHLTTMGFDQKQATVDR